MVHTRPRGNKDKGGKASCTSCTQLVEGEGAHLLVLGAVGALVYVSCRRRRWSSLRELRALACGDVEVGVGERGEVVGVHGGRHGDA